MHQSVLCTQPLGLRSAAQKERGYLGTRTGHRHIPCDPLSLRLEGLCARGFFTCSLSISAAMALSCREPNRPKEEVAVAEMQQHICSLGRASRKIVFVLQMGEGSFADR